jgi:hypothetical protein
MEFRAVQKLNGRKQNKSTLGRTRAQEKNKQDFFWAGIPDAAVSLAPNLVIKWSLTKIIYGT